MNAPMSPTTSPVAKALIDKALAELAGDKLSAAESTLAELLATGEREDVVWHNLGAIAAKRDEHAAAAELFERTLKINPNFAKAHANLATCYLELKRNAEALAISEQGLRRNPNDWKCLCCRSSALRRFGRLEEALQSALQAIRLAPSDVDSVACMARSLHDLNRLGDAIAWYTRALALDPSDLELRFNRSAAYLQLGDFHRGLEDYELRWECGGNKARLTEHDKPRWLNQFKLEGLTILLQVEQGLGDAIQFARYTKVLARRGAKVILQVRRELAALFADFEGATAVVAEGDPLPDFDCFVPLLSLPFLLGTTVDTIPADNPYLAAPEDRRAKWRNRLGERTRPRIGIVWSGNERHTNDHARSMSLADFPIPNPQLFEVFSLQKFVREGDRELLGRLAITQFGDDLEDMADTAAVAEMMDLVIAVDTSVAHLAAAVGRPVWMLVPFHADWRWLHGRETSPWYPTMRIFKQDGYGDWKGVFQKVTAALAKAAGIS